MRAMKYFATASLNSTSRALRRSSKLTPIVSLSRSLPLRAHPTMATRVWTRRPSRQPISLARSCLPRLLPAALISSTAIIAWPEPGAMACPTCPRTGSTARIMWHFSPRRWPTRSTSSTGTARSRKCNPNEEGLCRERKLLACMGGTGRRWPNRRVPSGGERSSRAEKGWQNAASLPTGLRWWRRGRQLPRAMLPPAGCFLALSPHDQVPTIRP